MPRWPTRTTEQRFNDWVDKTGECWVWTGSLNGSGYGRFGLHGRNVLAHRFSFEIERGPIPAGAEVCHTCDNPACVKPAHLFLGTHAENMADSKAKGRAVRQRGEANPRAKLTEEDVAQIRASRESGKELAERYGVSGALISRVRLGKSWRHIKKPEQGA